MLVKRIITGTILLLAFFFVLFDTSANTFFWLVSVLLALSSWEWGALIGLTSIPKRILLVLVYLMLALWMFWLPVGALLIAFTAWWCLAFILLLLYSKGRAAWAKHSWAGFLMGIPALGSAYVGFNVLRSFDNGASVVLYFILLIAAADSFAYFVGRALGRRKLFSMLSPNKTWEGFFAGVIASGLVAILASFYFGMSVKQASVFVALSLIAVLFSVVGDLFISLLKRQQGLKDTGRLLPGHGGLLDRLDGLNAASAIFALGVILMALGSN